MDVSTRHRRGFQVATALIGVLVGFGLGAGWASFAEEASDRSSTYTLPLKSAKSSAKPESTARDSQLDRKLDQLLAGQQTILQKFDGVLEELRVVKIRCSN